MINERKLIKRLLKAQKEQELAEKACSDYFFPLVREAMANKDFELAHKISMRLPDCVTKIFMWDNIRQAKGK